jgi:hypothetical protein
LLTALAAQNGALARGVGRLRAGVAVVVIASVVFAAWIGWPHVTALLHAAH